MHCAGEYDVIVVGAGHAGCEAALAAARMGCNTLLVTLNLEAIALMPCNPAVGGPAKGHLVLEIDALGGEIGKNISETYIQIRMLNTGKGAAVHALRAQADKQDYYRRMRNVLENALNLDVRQAVVDSLYQEDNKIQGVILNTGSFYKAKAVIITSGTYLRGKIIIGDLSYPGGPNAQIAPQNLSNNLKELGIKLLRFKTGTPPRVDRDTLDFNKMTIQSGDKEKLSFSFEKIINNNKQLPCWLTYTNEKTHKIINDNLYRAPLYSGTIEGTGPRYCPSIEDKIVRFADKNSHQIFLEPEGLNTREYYVQGLSTSLPEDVQFDMLRTIAGMEEVKIIRPGYAIEYDCVEPTQLALTLELKEVPWLYTAGQINGSSGYEEAAAQGIIAGINAALKVKGKEPLIIDRSQGYIGVLIDDLVTKGTAEPYRILTSRAEYRLLLRQDNADQRLTPLGYEIGLINKERYQSFLKKQNMIEQEINRLQENIITPSQEILEILSDLNSTKITKPVSLAKLLKRPEINYKKLSKFLIELPLLDEEIINQVETQIKYEGYIEKQKQQVERFKKLEGKVLSEHIDYKSMAGLSTEAREKLDALKPRSIGQASRISGVSPADVSLLLMLMEQRKRLNI